MWRNSCDNLYSITPFPLVLLKTTVTMVMLMTTTTIARIIIMMMTMIACNGRRDYHIDQHQIDHDDLTLTSMFSLPCSLQL